MRLSLKSWIVKARQIVISVKITATAMTCLKTKKNLFASLKEAFGVENSKEDIQENFKQYIQCIQFILQKSPKIIFF